MKKLYLLSILTFVFGVLGARAQVTTEPSPLQEDSQNVKIYYHADQGNKGLMGLNANTKVYAHTGLITSKSTSSSDWKYTIASWDKDTEKAEMVYEGENLWSLYIGDIREFYGVTNMEEKIEKLAFVFRTTGGTKEGKTESGGDIFVDVLDPGLQVLLSSNLTSNIIDATTGAVTFTVSSTSAANLSLSINGTQVATQDNATTLTAQYTFPGVGDYEVTGTASSGGETVSDIINIAYLGVPQAQDYPGGVPVMGPVENADGSVTFCIAAPEMSRVVLVGSWNDYAITGAQNMYYQDYNTTNPVTNESGVFRYFWVTVPELANTNDQYIYFFKVSGTPNLNGNTITVNTDAGDPYARLVLDPWNDKYIDTNVYPNLPAYPYDVTNNVPVAVYQKGINDYDWQVTDFELPDKTNLMVYELLFRDFTGTEGKANANGTVRQAIEKFDYIKELGVNAVELLPMYEFDGNISWGYNPNFYFAPDKAYGTPDDYKEFIDLCHQNGIAVILDMVFNQSAGQHPWCAMYGGTQYSPFYNAKAPHAYSVLDDWNQGYPLVQKQWEDVLTYWLTEYNFDGFRFDLVKGLGTNESYPNNGDSGTNQYNASRIAEMAYLNGVIQDVKPGAYCINENLAGAQEENEMAADGEINWANVNNAACQFAMGYSSDSNMNRLYAPQDNRTWGSTVSYIVSHDEQHLAYKQKEYGINGIKGNIPVSMQRCGSAAAQMIMTPGSHMIWMFSEMGNDDKNGDGNTDPKIVNWNLLNEPNHRGLYDNYCQLNEVRFKNPEMFTENVTFNINCNTSNWSQGRSLSTVYNGKELYTLVNPNITGVLNMNVDFINKDNSAYKILVKSYNSSPSFDAVNGIVSIPANCFVVIGSADLESTGIDSVLSDDAMNALRVRGGYGELIVDYAAAPATVYSLDGKVMGHVAETGSVNVASGVYVVKSGKHTAKVVVK